MHKKKIIHNIKDSPVLKPLYTRDALASSVPKYEMPKGEILPQTACSIIRDELMLDGNARLNLATFVTTWMDPEITELLAETFEKNMGIPPPLTVIAAAAELFGGIALVVGLLTRAASLSLGIIMVVAIFQAHLSHGFFINWEQAPGRGHGIEYNIALLSMCGALLISGPGKLSLDRLFGMEKD